MSKSDRQNEQQFEALFVEYHEALIDGRSQDSRHEPTPALIDRLREAQSCLDLLHEMWTPQVQPPVDPPPGSTGPGDTDAADFRPFETPGANVIHGATIGRFQIERELGHGGGGLVLLAVDPKLGRRVALKVPRPEGLLSRDARLRFLREAEAAARLSHPHIVAVYEVGEAGPVCYIAQEYCVGPSLAAWLAARTAEVPVREAAAVVATLAAAVHHAHMRGVLHRDLKPSNVLLDRESASSDDPIDLSAELASFVPKVGDFGLAKLLEREGDETRSGTVLGTPRYMAPEQAEGRVHDVGVHTDAYALGTIFYELLCGAPPHSGATDTDTLRRVLLEEPVPPRRTRPEVSHDLQAICLKALEKSPERRYATAAALEEDLRRYLAGQPTVARPLGAAARAWKWARRRPAIAALSAAMAAALATILAGTIVYSARLQTALTETVRQREVARESARRSRQLLYASDMRRAFEAWKNESAAQVLELLDQQIPANGEDDWREFSWHYLRGLCHQQQWSVAAHKGDVFSVACSPDGRVLASGGKDRAIRLWDVASGQDRGEIKGHTDDVMRVAFAPGGDALASASEDWTVRLWSLPDGASRGILRGHRHNVLCLAYSSDGRWLASGSRDRTVRVWDASSGESIVTLETGKEYVSSLDFTRDGKLLVAGDGDGVVYSWRTGSWQPLDRLATRTALSSENLFALVHSPHRDWIAGAGRQNVVHLWETGDKGLRSIGELTGGHAERIQSLAFSPASNTLASADKRGVIQLWDMSDLGKRRPILGQTERVWSVAWSPDGRRLASASADGTINVWNANDSPDGGVGYPPLPTSVHDIVISPDGGLLVVTCHDGTICWLDTVSRELVESFEVAERSKTRFSPDGKYLARRMESGGVRVWKRGAQHDLLNLPATKPPPGDNLAWSTDSQSLATTIDPTTPAILNVYSGKIEHRFHTQTTVYGMTFSPDGRQFAVGADRLRIWNPRTDQLIADLPQRGGAMCYSADSRLLAVNWHEEVSVFDATAGQLLRKLLGRVDHVAMALSPDGKTLAATAQTPSGIMLWDVRTGQELLTIEAPAVRVTHLLFSSQGDRLVAAGEDETGKSRLWEWSTVRGVGD